MGDLSANWREIPRVWLVISLVQCTDVLCHAGARRRYSQPWEWGESRVRRTALLLGLLSILVSGCRAQTAHVAAAPALHAAGLEAEHERTAADASDDSEPVAVFHSTVQEVNVVFTATNRHGKFKRDLRVSDLRVLDDGKPPAAVRSFESETNLPLRVGLVMDVSGSIRGRFNFEQESAVSFFRQMLHPGVDQAFVVTFNSLPVLTQDFSDSAALLEQGVRTVTAGGGSAVYDAVKFAATAKLAHCKADQPVRRVIILLSDGEDNQSRATPQEVIEAASRAEVTVFAISSNFSNIKSRGDMIMERLAEETGGRVFYPAKIEDVGHAFKLIEEELRSQYALSYKPADFVANGRYRPIQISTRSDKNVIVRVRKGYYVPAD